MIASQRRLHVLVIEDEPLISMVVEFAIEQLGHDMVGPFARLDEAIAAAGRDDYDCAVVDVNIVGGASYAVAKLLVDKQRPFFLASGYGDWALPENLRNQPRLVKPYTGQQLDTELQRLFDRCAAAPA